MKGEAEGPRPFSWRGLNHDSRRQILGSMANSYHLAQVNIATSRAPMDDPVMQGFVDRLEALNALADRSPGFVWRLQTEDGDATAIRVFDNPLILFNLTVWDSVEALEAYVYRSDHVEAVKRRAEWFEKPDRSPFALWWIPAGHIPDEVEAKQRLERLWREGPTAEAFTFRRRYPPPGVAMAATK